jgi:hypothetical protein
MLIPVIHVSAGRELVHKPSTLPSMLLIKVALYETGFEKRSSAPHEPRESSSVGSVRLLDGLLCCHDLLCPVRSSFKFAF